jgi:hypothetical protein
MKIPHTIITDGVGNAKVPSERFFLRLLLTTLIALFETHSIQMSFGFNLQH